MGLLELLAAMGLTGLVSVKVAGLLADRLISNRLAKDLKEFEAKLTTAVNAAKAEVEAHHKREVELALGDAAAERAYRSEAKKRLYQALGPLRFQLMVAASEWSNRVARIGDKDAGTYDMSIQGHFLRSTAYRFLRLLAVAMGLHPLPALITGFTPTSRPILWLRMLASSQLCLGLIEVQGEALGLEVQDIELETMLFLAGDQPISSELPKYLAALRRFRTVLSAASKVQH